MVLDWVLADNPPRPADLLGFVEAVLVAVGEVEPGQLVSKDLLGLGDLVQGSLQLHVTRSLDAHKDHKGVLASPCSLTLMCFLATAATLCQ